MDGKKFAKILIGLFTIISGFITRNMALESYKREAEVFEWLGLLMVVFGIVDIIVAFAQKSENSTSNNTNISNQKHQSSSMFIICPYCGEENSIRNEHCFRCHRIINTHTKEDVPTNGWICSKCKKVNANYVGTCGCGERKP